MKLTLASEDGVLLATASGRASVEEVLRVFKKVIDAAIERQFDKVLMDLLAMTGMLSDFDLYEIGKTMAEYCVSRSFYPRVAVIGNPPSVNGLGAHVASNRGLTSMTFSASQPALTWLRAFDSKAPGS